MSKAEPRESVCVVCCSVMSESPVGVWREKKKRGWDGWRRTKPHDGGLDAQTRVRTTAAPSLDVVPQRLGNSGQGWVSCSSRAFPRWEGPRCTDPQITNYEQAKSSGYPKHLHLGIPNTYPP